MPLVNAWTFKLVCLFRSQISLNIFPGLIILMFFSPISYVWVHDILHQIVSGFSFKIKCMIVKLDI